MVYGEQPAQEPTESSWSQEEGVAFEAAQELLNRIHGRLLAESQELHAHADDSEVVQSEIVHIQDLIRGLDPLDHSGITHIRKFYGPIARSYREEEPHGNTQPQ